MIDTLENAGLTRTEANVYIFLLRNGASPQAEITKSTQLHRRTVYDVLARLVEKGVISSITKNNRQFYEAVRPERFKEILDEKSRALDAAMPKLNAMLKGRPGKEQTKFFSGRHGLKAIFEDQIAEGKTILIMGASPMANRMMKYYFTSFDRRRVEKKIKARIILDRSVKGKFKRVPLAQVRYIGEQIGSVAATNIYGDKVAIILWNELTPFAILIESKDIADSYRKIFEVAWERAKSKS